MTVLFFAQARELAGRSRLEVPVGPGGATLASVLSSVEDRFPGLGRVLRRSRLAVNGEYVSAPGTRLRPGDEVAIHPPYSGG